MAVRRYGRAVSHIPAVITDRRVSLALAPQRIVLNDNWLLISSASDQSSDPARAHMQSAQKLESQLEHCCGSAVKNNYSVPAHPTKYSVLSIFIEPIIIHRMEYGVRPC